MPHLTSRMKGKTTNETYQVTVLSLRSYIIYDHLNSTKALMFNIVRYTTYGKYSLLSRRNYFNLMENYEF